jgi:hypothetical protein
MFMISYKTKVHLSKCNGSRIVSTKQTMNFNIQLAAMFFFDKNGLIKLNLRSISIQNFMVRR